MKWNILMFIGMLLWTETAYSQTLKHYMQTRIGVFDACTQTFEYSFTKDNK